LKWILVGGFAAIFALGFVYLLRRPQVASAAAGGAVAADAYETPAPKRAAKLSSTSASASGATVAAEVDREVRGSLDELKDSLFRLELRRQAGTISEEDYAHERERIDATLRNLVRG
jgi:hypothetical protein